MKMLKEEFEKMWLVKEEMEKIVSSEAYDKGYEVGYGDELFEDENPFEDGSFESFCWLAGFGQGSADW